MVNEYDFGVFRVLRKKKDLTLEKLAAQTGIAYSTLALIEENKRTPSLDTLEKLAETFALPVDRLLSLAARRLVRICRAKPISDELHSTQSGDIQSVRMATFNESKIFHCTGLAGQQVHAPQFHRDCLEITFLIRGSIRAVVEGREFILATGEAILFDGTFEHAYTVLEDAEVVCIHIPRDIRLLDSLIETRESSSGFRPG